MKSRLLNYAENTGQVRDSVADVRMKHMLPAIPTIATSLQIKKEGEFDRLLLVFGRFLAGLNITSIYDFFLFSSFSLFFLHFPSFPFLGSPRAA